MDTDVGQCELKQPAITVDWGNLPNATHFLSSTATIGNFTDSDMEKNEITLQKNDSSGKKIGEPTQL